MMVLKTVPDYSEHEAGSKERIAAERITVFEVELRKMLWIEKALLRFIPKMMESAATNALKESLNSHHRQRKAHVISLESVFKILRFHPESLKNTEIEKVLIDSELSMKNNRHTAQDSGIVKTLLQLKEHAQQAYKELSEQAENLEMNESAQLLLEMHAHEKAYSEEISQIQLDS